MVVMTTVHERVYHLHITHSQPFQTESREGLRDTAQRARAVHVGKLKVIGVFREAVYLNWRDGWLDGDQSSIGGYVGLGLVECCMCWRLNLGT